MWRKKMNDENIRVEEVVDALKNRWQLIVVITLIATILATVVSFFIIKPKYQASTKLFIGKESSGKVEENYNNNDVQMYQKLLKTYSDVIMTKDLVEKSLAVKNINLKTGEVLGNLRVTPKTDTQILLISYTSTDKQESKAVVDAITTINRSNFQR
jgi:capsular polysaccharide biosynthesis protein